MSAPIRVVLWRVVEGVLFLIALHHAWQEDYAHAAFTTTLALYAYLRGRHLEVDVRSTP
jgi:hypothetical protein